jgi:hypothetical protein
MYFYLVKNGDLVDEVFATNLSEYDAEQMEKELQDKNGDVKIIKSEKRLNKEVKKLEKTSVS